MWSAKPLVLQGIPIMYKITPLEEDAEQLAACAAICVLCGCHVLANPLAQLSAHVQGRPS